MVERVSGTVREPGWYRLTGRGWESVDASDAAEEIKAGGGWDLVCVETRAAGTETLLF